MNVRRPASRFADSRVASNLATAALILLAFAATAGAAVVTVNDAGDATNACATTGAGTCTLRDAITYANAHSGSTIAFNIAGGGVHTITPATQLPNLITPVTIDGYTQPGSSPNTNGPTQGTNAVLLIELDGVNTPGSFGFGVLLFAGPSTGSVVRGLAINRSKSAGIQVDVSNMVIEGNFIGVDPTGMIAQPNMGYGIAIEGAFSNVLVGGTTPAARNVISGNALAGVEFAGGSTGHFVQGNLIGTNAAGTGALPGFQTGIATGDSVSGVTIGGTTPAARNVIAGNYARGILLSNSLGNPTVTNNVIQGNFIGTDVTGTQPLGNASGVSIYGLANTVGGSAAGAGNVISGNAGTGIDDTGGNGLVVEGNFIGTDLTGTIAIGNHGTGIALAGSDMTVGGVAPGAGNVIAFNTGSFPSGVTVSGTGNPIRGNSMHDNAALGIDLGGDGVTPNDLGDADAGANNLQNFPVLSSVTYGVSNTTVAGLLNSTPNTTFQLDFYADPACSNFPREFLQGRTYLGSSPATTDGSGNVSFSVTTLAATENGARISATATDPAGNTSEISQRLPFSINTHSGPPSGGTALTISGTNFLAGATVTIGGVPATGVSVDSYVSISATSPALAPGTANDLVVSNTDATHGTLVKAFVANFTDVPNVNQFYSYVTTLVSNAITAGVGGGLYGVADNTLRQQMAVFILKAKHGLCYTPPPCVGMFTDVPCSSNFAPWIEAMANEGITTGCGVATFCPQNPVRRDQMAVFLLRAEHGSNYLPPDCIGVFTDVTCPSPFANWIERLAAENITGGCGTGTTYCPLNPNTRGQMAVFITKTFNLQ
jgi:parallel beta-helix repeat protein